MKRTGNLTGVLLLTAFVATGCSDKPETPPARADSPHVSPVEPMTIPGEPASVPQTADAEVAPPETPTVASFADGEAAYHAKKYEEAMAIFEAYTQRRPGNAWGHYMLALSAWKHGELAKSEQSFEKALSIDPRHLKSYVNLSRVYIDQNRYDDAIEQLTRAAGVDPHSWEVHRLLGRTYHSHGKADEAVAAYRRAIELNERDAWSLHNLGLLFLETGRPDEALPLLIQAVEVRKDVAEFHNNLGVALEQIGHHSAAATAYSSALRVDPLYDQAKQNLARVEPR